VRWLASGRERAVAGFGWAEWGVGPRTGGRGSLGRVRGKGKEVHGLELLGSLSINSSISFPIQTNSIKSI
jgi:hypothetical protein